MNKKSGNLYTGKRSYLRLIIETILATSFILVLVFIGINMNSIDRAKDYFDNKSKYVDIISKKSAEYSVPESVIYAVIMQESEFKSDAESRVGARGLMQIMEITCDWIDIKKGNNNSWDKMFDPEINIDYGTWLLSYLYGLYEDWETVYAAYNAGFNAVNLWLEDKNYSKDGIHLDVIPYSETEKYVNRVSAYQKWYELTYNIK